MPGKREVLILLLAGLVLVASVAGALQIADLRRDEGALVTSEQFVFAPGPDADGDGVPDASDACPAEPETFNGFRDQDGCPDAVTRTRAS